MSWLPRSWGRTPSAGRVSFIWRGLAFHLLHDAQPGWGHVEEWCDGPLHYITLGPLLLVCWRGTFAEALLEKP